MNSAVRRGAGTGWIALPLVLVFAYQLLSPSGYRVSHLLHTLVFIASVWLVAALTHPVPVSPSTWRWPWRALLLPGVAWLAIFASPGLNPTFVAWLGLGCAWSLAINIQTQLATHQSRAVRLVWLACVGIASTGWAVLVAQLEAGFSEEELFTWAEWSFLAILFAALAQAHVRLWEARVIQTPAPRAGFSLPSTLLALIVLAASLIGAVLGIREYQYSISPASAPSFAGIDAQHPFLCGEAPPDPTTYDGQTVYRQILELLAANPEQDTPELGMLALGSHDERWAEQFRTNLLTEAGQGKFTGPANSVKYSQFEAALRVYYYARLRDAFPRLFSPGDQETLKSWFAAINRRLWTVEWVDGLYALAYAQPPLGLFYNQEIGVGLLALLEDESLADPGLSERNRAYLESHSSGWEQRFRNSDDTLVYQQEWIYNAWFQSLQEGSPDTDQVRRSFLWLMLQAPPDGSMLRMNHPVALSQIGIAYLGATLLQDEELLWMSGRSAEFFQSSGEEMTAVPGADYPLALDAHSPTYGSCALFADSGTPVQVGPLAPDKLVFRDGWSYDAAYLLVNLRSTGWHRYKSTATVTSMYQSGPLLVEQLQGEVPFWLPAGRSLFRDKRIPRENLNGLVLGRTGLGAVLHTLTGLGSEWTQDPPQFAELLRFENQPGADMAQIRLADWHGWQLDRLIHFIHQGPVVFIDTASGPDFIPAELVWHLVGAAPLQEQAGQIRIRLRDSPNPAEIVFLPLDAGGQIATHENTGLNAPELKVQYQPAQRGRLSLVTVVLTRDWLGTQVSVERSGGFPALVIGSGLKRVSLPLP